MSVFGKSFLSMCTDAAHVSVDEARPDVEVADGVHVERRSVLWLSAAAVTAALGSPGLLRGQDRGGKQDKGSGRRKPPQDKAHPDFHSLSFAQFLNEIAPLAKRMVNSKSHDDAAYLLTVAAALSRLRDPGDNLRQTMRTFASKHKKPGERFPLSAMSMRLKPGGGFPPHDHRNYNGVILGLEGEVRIRNFDIQGKDPIPPAGKTFQLRETRDDLILPGRLSSVGLRDDNIHELVAGKAGARVLDVFTFFGGGGSHYLDMDKKPRDPDRRIYDATWRPRRRRRRR